MNQATAELEEKVWQLLAACVLDCRYADLDEQHRVIEKYVPQALALIQDERHGAVKDKLGELYSLAPELRSPLWRRLRTEVAKLRAQTS